MKENDRSEKNWTGRRVAQKIDRSTTNDVEDVVQLIAGMGKALAGIFIAPFRERRRRRDEAPTNQTANAEPEPEP